MSDLIERLRGPCPSIPAMRDAANEVGRLRAALAQSIGTVRELMAERDALRARIDGAVKVEDFRRYICGHEYLDISGTDETEVSDGNLYGKRVALVVIE
jgi:hypothetical protein